MPVECQSVFKKGEARLSVAPAVEKQNAAFKHDGGFDFSLPYPFLFEPAPAPWLGWRSGSGQIVPSGVGRGVGMNLAQTYCKMLDGAQVVEEFNRRFASAAKRTESYIEQAGFVKAMIMKLLQIQRSAEVFADIQKTGVNWASSTFMYYLCAGYDEAFAIALYSSSCDTMPVTPAILQQFVAPLVSYGKARSGWSSVIASPQFGQGARQRAYHACLGYCLQNVHCPWHERRDLKKDAETGKVMQICLDALAECDAKERLKKQVRAFLKGCTLPIISSLKVDVDALLVSWLATQTGFISKSSQLIDASHNAK